MDILRNTGFLFRKHTAVMVLNLAGLILAFCAFISIMEKVRYENSYDRFYPESDRIFRVDQEGVEGTFHSVLPPGFADAVIKSSPHIVAGTLWCPFAGEQYVVVTDSLGQEHGFKYEVNNVSGGIFDVFGIDVLEGDRNALYEPDKVAIPESMARKMFGDAPAVGRHLEMRAGAGFITGTDWTVGAVYKDIPENSQLRNNILIPIPEFFLRNFGSSNFLCWLRLDDASSAEEVAEEFNSHFDFSVNEYLSHIGLTPVRDIYYLEEGSDSRVFRSGSRTMTSILTAVAFLILLTGAFNFTNFYASLIPSRIRGINTRKVFGASGAALRRDFFIETTMLSLLAGIISCIVMYAVQPGSIPFRFVAICLIASVFCGVISGIYPGAFATSFQPAAVLKSGYGIPASGRKLKKVLLVLQLSVCMFMLVSMIYIRLQNEMMMTYDTGFDKDSLAVVELPVNMVSSEWSVLRNEALKSPVIEDVAFASEIIGGQETYITETLEWKGKDIQTFIVYCSDNFLTTAGIHMTGGQNFKKGNSGSIIMNEDARKEYGLVTGLFPGFELWALDGRAAELSGFSGNVRFSSLKHESMPICFCSLSPEYGYYNIAYIRMAPGSDRKAVTGHIQKVVHNIDPAYPVEVLYYDEILQSLYAKDLKFSRMILLFTLLATILAMAGTFSVVLFDSQYHRREYAIKKVYGSTSASAIAETNVRYAALVALSFVICIPISWYIVSQWLERFAVRVDIYAWPYFLSLLIVLSLTVLTVTCVCFRAVRANPAKVLRNE